MRIVLIIQLLLFHHSTLLWGQIEDRNKQVENFHYRIKNIEFFIDRFNNQIEGSGSNTIQIPTDSTMVARFINERDTKILSLFDVNRIKKADKKLRQAINSFILQINREQDSQFIKFTDAEWFASLILTTRHSGKQDGIQCTLSIHSPGNHQFSWIIRSFLSPELKLEEQIEGSELFFPPNVNGTDFMEVRLQLNNPEWISGKLSKIPDTTSVMLQKLNTREFTIESIGNITYHFLKIPGWIFTVKYVDRETRNSGWLIHEIFEATDEEKVLYKRRFLID